MPSEIGEPRAGSRFRASSDRNQTSINQHRAASATDSKVADSLLKAGGALRDEPEWLSETLLLSVLRPSPRVPSPLSLRWMHWGTNPDTDRHGKIDAHQDDLARDKAGREPSGGLVEFRGRLLDALAVSAICKAMHDSHANLTEDARRQVRCGRAMAPPPSVLSG